MRMKHLVLSLLLAVCTVCSAQTNHMKFKGIPIDGTLNSFVQKLKDKGYTFIGQQDGFLKENLQPPTVALLELRDSLIEIR